MLENTYDGGCFKVEFNLQWLLSASKIIELLISVTTINYLFKETFYYIENQLVIYFWLHWQFLKSESWQRDYQLVCLHL